MTGLFQAVQGNLAITEPISSWSNTATPGTTVDVVPAATNVNGLLIVQAFFYLNGTGTGGEMYFGTYPFWKGAGWVSLAYAAKGISGMIVPAGTAITINCLSGTSSQGSVSGWLL
jgi:hypothetical protein